MECPSHGLGKVSKVKSENKKMVLVFEKMPLVEIACWRMKSRDNDISCV